MQTGLPLLQPVPCLSQCNPLPLLFSLNRSCSSIQAGSVKGFIVILYYGSSFHPLGRLSTLHCQGMRMDAYSMPRVYSFRPLGRLAP